MVEMMEQQEIRQTLQEVMGEEGCGEACSDADLFYDEDGWKLRMCGFLEPWKLGGTVSEAKQTLRELGSMRFGLS